MGRDIWIKVDCFAAASSAQAVAQEVHNCKQYLDAHDMGGVDDKAQRHFDKSEVRRVLDAFERAMGTEIRTDDEMRERKP